MRSKTKVWLVVGALVAASLVPAGQATGRPDPNRSPALCGPRDTREPGIQGDVAPAGGVNCGLSFLSHVPGGGSVQGSGHCAYVRVGSVIKAYDLTDPAHPVQTDEEPTRGGSESMRAQTTADRAILVSGRGVYDIRDCEDLVLKGEIPWPSLNATLGANIAATSSHELGVSHDARRVYSGLGFAIAHIDDLDDPGSWTVDNWTCEMNRQSGFPVAGLPEATATLCDVLPQADYPRQYSHSSDDNAKGTRWYGANQNGDGVSQLEPSTLRVVDVTDPARIEILDALPDVPGHSMNWWRVAGGREFTLSANESLSGPGDTCQPRPRPTNLGNATEGYITEVTGDELKHAALLSLKINEPENCEAAKASGANATITEHSIYNKGKAAFAMVEFGGAGLRVFDLRRPYQPREVAYFNTGTGHVHSGVFHYDARRGIMLASGSTGMQVLELQPQVIRALGLPKPTDRAYPRYPKGRAAQPLDAPTSELPGIPGLGIEQHAGDQVPTASTAAEDASITVAPETPAEVTPSVVAHRHRCGQLDREEPGIQGDVPRVEQEANRAVGGYNCGLALVGHTSLAGPDRDSANFNMAWSGHCAYVAGSSGALPVPGTEGPPSQTAGVAVVDVKDPSRPRMVGSLTHPGGLESGEAIHAIDVRSRSVLVVGDYGNDSFDPTKAFGENPDPASASIYDVSRCATPRLLETIEFPENIHNLTLSGDGRYLFGTMPLQVFDLDALYDRDPRTKAEFLGNLEDAVPAPPVSPAGLADHDDAVPWPTRGRVLSHEAWPSRDGHRLVLGSQMTPWEVFTILDISAWLRRDGENRPSGAPVVVSQRAGRGHSIRTATIGARSYALHSEESVTGAAFGCFSEELNPIAGPAEPWLTDLTDPANPVRVAQFGLEINQPAHCGDQLDSGVNTSAHYHDFDRSTDARFSMVSMWNAGVRVFDVRNPRKPVEVAYFNTGDVDPGEGTTLDVAAGHIRYVASTGHIWFTTVRGGFWVVELEPRLRRALGLDGPRGAPPSVHPNGRPGTVGITSGANLDPLAGLLATYCTLATVRSAA